MEQILKDLGFTFKGVNLNKQISMNPFMKIINSPGNAHFLRDQVAKDYGLTAVQVLAIVDRVKEEMQKDGYLQMKGNSFFGTPAQQQKLFGGTAKAAVPYKASSSKRISQLLKQPQNSSVKPSLNQSLLPSVFSNSKNSSGTKQQTLELFKKHDSENAGNLNLTTRAEEAKNGVLMSSEKKHFTIHEKQVMLSPSHKKALFRDITTADSPTSGTPPSSDEPLQAVPASFIPQTIINDQTIPPIQVALTESTFQQIDEELLIQNTVENTLNNKIEMKKDEQHLIGSQVNDEENQKFYDNEQILFAETVQEMNKKEIHNEDKIMIIEQQHTLDEQMDEPIKDDEKCSNLKDQICGGEVIEEWAPSIDKLAQMKNDEQMIEPLLINISENVISAESDQRSHDQVQEKEQRVEEHQMSQQEQIVQQALHLLSEDSDSLTSSEESESESELDDEEFKYDEIDLRPPIIYTPNEEIPTIINQTESKSPNDPVNEIREEHVRDPEKVNEYDNFNDNAVCKKHEITENANQQFMGLSQLLQSQATEVQSNEPIVPIIQKRFVDAEIQCDPPELQQTGIQTEEKKKEMKNKKLQVVPEKIDKQTNQNGVIKTPSPIKQQNPHQPPLPHNNQQTYQLLNPIAPNTNQEARRSPINNVVLVPGFKSSPANLSSPTPMNENVKNLYQQTSPLQEATHSASTQLTSLDQLLSQQPTESISTLVCPPHLRTQSQSLPYPSSITPPPERSSSLVVTVKPILKKRQHMELQAVDTWKSNKRVRWDQEVIEKHREKLLQQKQAAILRRQQLHAQSRRTMLLQQESDDETEEEEEEGEEVEEEQEERQIDEADSESDSEQERRVADLTPPMRSHGHTINGPNSTLLHNKLAKYQMPTVAQAKVPQQPPLDVSTGADADVDDEYEEDDDEEEEEQQHHHKKNHKISKNKCQKMRGEWSANLKAWLHTLNK